MVPIKNLRFDCYLNRFKAQNQKQFTDVIARQMTSVCHADRDQISELLNDKLDQSERVFIEGATVIDVQSELISEPAMVLGTLQKPLSLPFAGNTPFDVVSVVLSTPECGSTHLQKLSKVSRLLRAEEFCAKVRSCSSEESMEILFMPAHKLVKVA